MRIAELIGWAVTTFAIAGAVANLRRMRACFALWIVSNAGSGGLHIASGMIALAARDAVFLALAVAGLFAWKGRKRKLWSYPLPQTR